MTFQDMELRMRAIRMLTDGRRHSPQAMKWAERQTQLIERRRVEELRRAGFTLAEISLGSGEVTR